LVPPPAKPIAIWLAQLWFALLFLGGCYAAYQNRRYWIEMPLGMLRGGAFLVATGATLVGLQLRIPWARFSAVILTVLFLGIQVWSVRDWPALVPFAVFELLLAWRVAFGEPSRAYFAGKPVTPVQSFEES
jgi:hypothetical protein